MTSAKHSGCSYTEVTSGGDSPRPWGSPADIHSTLLLVEERYYTGVRCPPTLPYCLWPVPSVMTYRRGEAKILGRSGWVRRGGSCHCATFCCENRWAVLLTKTRGSYYTGVSLMDIPTQPCILHLSPVGESLVDSAQHPPNHPPSGALEGGEADWLSFMSPGLLCHPLHRGYEPHQWSPPVLILPVSRMTLPDICPLSLFTTSGTKE